jgi:putative two-component system response regulator
MVARVLVVDDEVVVCRAIERILKAAGHDCRVANSVAEARAELSRLPFQLVLCDVNMEGESGLALVAEVSRELVDTAVVMVTGVDDPAVARQAITLGAYGYLVKPFTPNEILIQAEGALRRRTLERARRFHTEELEAKLLDRSAALRGAFRQVEEAQASASVAHHEMVERLTMALTLRDEETGRHIERVGRYAALLGDHAGVRDWPAEDLRMAAMLHDVGKIGVPDMVLLKPSALSEDERVMIRRHPEIGHRLLEAASNQALRLGASVALSHHEWWDGTGYPQLLAGEAIPIEGRLTAVADCFDALTSDRVYRPALSLDEATAAMERERGTHFDPRLLDVFLARLDQFWQIRQELPDPEAPNTAIRVLVVDEHGMFVETLVRMLERSEGLRVVATASSVREAFELARSFEPDVVVAQWQLADATAADLARSCRSAGLPVQTVVLTDAPEEDVLMAAIGAGCAGCVSKQRAFDELVSAIRAAFAGEPAVPPQQLLSLLRRLHPSEVRGSVQPTDREREVLSLMAEGLSTDAIAERLDVSLNTARNHIQRVITKLGAHSRLEAVAAGVRTGLIARG